jgi:hypothetical protein
MKMLAWEKRIITPEGSSRHGASLVGRSVKMLLIALVAFLALVVAWFVLPGGTEPALGIEIESGEPARKLATAEA